MTKKIYVIRFRREKEEKTEEKSVPSSEILVPIPEKKGCGFRLFRLPSEQRVLE
jgi:hypothetical protein